MPAMQTAYGVLHITLCMGLREKGVPVNEDQRKAIASVHRKEKATLMEESFGTEKEHYGLQKIKARTMKNEMLWIFFGIHTANTVRISKRMTQEKCIQQAA